MKDDFFSFANRVFSHEFFCLVWLKIGIIFPGYCFTLFKIINKKMPSASQNTDAMTFTADGTDLVFLGAEQPASVHCFDCSLDSGV
jgi:hypothetical protein